MTLTSINPTDLHRTRINQSEPKTILTTMNCDLKDKKKMYHFNITEIIWIGAISLLTLKAPITTAADGKFCDIFSYFRKNKVWYFMRIVCQQMILMKYHTLFTIFEKAAKLSSAANCRWRFKV